MKRVYLLAWMADDDGKPHVYFEFSNVHRYRNQNSNSETVARDNVSVTAYCDHIHGNDIVKNSELKEIAICYLDGNYNVTHIDLGS